VHNDRAQAHAKLTASSCTLVAQCQLAAGRDQNKSRYRDAYSEALTRQRLSRAAEIHSLPSSTRIDSSTLCHNAKCSSASIVFSMPLLVLQDVTRCKIVRRLTIKQQPKFRFANVTSQLCNNVRVASHVFSHSNLNGLQQERAYVTEGQVLARNKTQAALPSAGSCYILKKTMYIMDQRACATKGDLSQ
jgi:hypothetical protein